jgi:tRNA threonylcarbamoyladenosine biosynthesis protein TsaE
VHVPDRDAMVDLGRRLATVLEVGDLVALSGALGSGKTTLTLGIAAGLHVEGIVTSPTYVLTHYHRSRVDGPSLLHADAYRLGDDVATSDGIADLGLEDALADSVVVVEWGAGIADHVSPASLLVIIDRSVGEEHRAPVATDDAEDDGASGERVVTFRGRGSRWSGSALRALA